MLKHFAHFITDKLSWLLVVAGILGFIFSPIATFLSPLTPFLLALMVAGSGFNLSLQEVFEWRGTLILTVVTLVTQLTLLPLIGFGIYQVLPNSAFAVGILAVAVAPSEITSALMTMLAGGDLALATRLMAFSIFLTTFLIPLWLNLFLGQSVPLDLGGMIVELGLIITLPFLSASWLCTRFSKLANYETEFGSLSALAVVVLIFIVGGSIASFNLDFGLFLLILACLIFNLAGYLVGWLIGRFLRQSADQLKALIFSSGMREFGIATAVALNFLPTGASLIPAIYGLLMMVTASIMSKKLKMVATTVNPLNRISDPSSK